MVSISMALTINKRVELAFVYLPALDQMYQARKGHGTFLNGKQVKVIRSLIFTVKLPKLG